MKISYSWLKEYVDFCLSPQELADKLTNVGLVVADIKPVEDDFCLDIEVTSNRSDCLGIIGIAREVAAAVGGSLHSPETPFVTANTEISKFIDITVEEPILCPRYTARVIRQITVGHSPEWIQKRLKCIGLRPVNNIVDITNYVMMETGQPLHAFDLDKLTEQKIIVRKARSGDEIVVINGARRALFHDMLVIADGRRPVAVAGIMGGKETEVSESTKSVLLECAQFEPRQVRRTSRALGIASDSSYRFERGTDPEGLDHALQRAISLIKDYAGGEIASGAIDIRAGRYEAKKITLRVERLRKVLGVEIKRDVAIDILKKLQFTILNDIDNFIDVEVPSFRGDAYREIDLIEEVARIYGYNNIPTRTSITVRGSAKNKYEIVENTTRQFLTSLGFYEVKTFSIVDISPLQSVNLWSDRVGIDIVNPLRQEESRLRTSLLPSLIKTKRYNMNHGTEQIKIFEIAKVYLAGDKLPDEKTCLSILADVDFFALKGIVESLLLNLGIVSGSEWRGDIGVIGLKLFKNEKSAKISLGEEPLGFLGEAKELGSKISSCMVELDMDLLVEKTNFTKKYRPLSQYPPVFRDLAIIVNETHTWDYIEKCIRNTPVNCLREINFFDVYRGKQVPAGKKSVAFNLCFQDHDRTLTSEEVDNAQQIILASLHKTLGADLRKA
ncbi:MAG: phenylalanine--tRNA ligase subunit beta [Candidatus Brocadia sp. AMX2]|uniref:Phenylalanine--tRNA ligase beta subunit n=1 Tax=Candidatus Brocadia sinica JPN1 TaxID=1197129 RepID=A0ABQ0JSH1_9BACT|nr:MULTISPECIES: phenylalanine--tRNA ligase subunit beta [Brocadia]KXK28171.1 MAG: phenylalanyl-tRNA synthase beta subunit [Candidatus Brocadia sinica]MBC6931319.1 phenylalanine--tRNA ligase subunit beta [Candidatus Brocadia sp.]MBL1168666.1 phenylalanine--tRNA ligase subunit beta [Candidatus Brocadia sp. AMX1]NOG43266.1 phenylalanine--tRNA ligase subunit beta [Planctomycetota bacterium]KAA0245943.1 MAG: phenylalanine--tRNA ligase subunit beta [Candidatus Brocadia sp. AMX2]